MQLYFHIFREHLTNLHLLQQKQTLSSASSTLPPPPLSKTITPPPQLQMLYNMAIHCIKCLGIFWSYWLGIFVLTTRASLCLEGQILNDYGMFMAHHRRSFLVYFFDCITSSEVLGLWSSPTGYTIACSLNVEIIRMWGLMLWSFLSLKHFDISH